MFKRILVLVLFLSLVFWWLSSRNDDKVETPDTNTEVQTEVEGETEEGDENEEDSSESEEGEESADEEATTEDEAEATTTEATETSSTTETTTTTPAATTTTTTTAPQTTYRPPVVTVPDVQTNVKVYMYEWNIDMSNKTIPTGTVNFQVQNDGRFAHDFSIKGFGNLGKINPGQSQTFTLKLRPGNYEAFSDRRQDYERGVKANFIVE